MAGLLRMMRPAAPAIPDIDDEENVNDTDYSIAVVYHGPPVTYDIPKVIPVDISQVSVAASVSSASLSKNLSLPVVQPIVKSRPLNRKSSTLGSQVIRIDYSSELACDNRYDSDSKAKLSDGNESSDTLPFSGILDDDEKEGEIFEDYMNPSGESEASSCREDDGNDEEAPHHVKRPSIVTFRDPESGDVVIHEEFNDSEEVSVSVSPKVARNVKKRVCYRCQKGNRFTEKEVCIVCGAKYCYDCVLRAMGSMPEGRKCVTCIGIRINEARRGMLGKSSRMLKRLLIDLEVQRVMKAEVLCQVNQVPPALVFVNGEPLSQEELAQLQNCQHPPNNLRPGCYWYDRLSGFWGKEGQKPSQIISPELNVGGTINENASNGNTNVLINGRRITKEELWMLKAAGVPCEGRPHFWVSYDGSYQEEGQNNKKTKIWDKTRTRLVCAFLSLPVPPDSKGPSGEEVNEVIQENLVQKHKLLLVGYDKAGTSTIYKQAKLLYDVPFSEDERQAIKLVIQRNLYMYLGILLEGREQFEEQSLLEKRKRRAIDKSGPSGDKSQIDDTTIYSIDPRVKPIADWLLQVMVLGNLETIFPGGYAPSVEVLWNHAAIQATYDRRNELEMLPRAATYFLDRAVEISRTDYEPSLMDILYAEGITSFDSVACMDFSFPKSTRDELEVHSDDQHDPSISYQLLRVHPRSLGVNCKWLDMFEDADILIFCVSLTDYDEFSEDFNGVLTNKMVATKQLFESIVTHRTFEKKKMNCLLILNKFDLLEEKIEQVPLRRCEWFHDFNPIISQNCHNGTNPSLAQRAFYYIAMKFKTLFRSLTDNKLFVSRVIGFENDTVDEALRYAREIVLWEEEKTNNFNNDSTTDMEASTTS